MAVIDYPTTLPCPVSGSMDSGKSDPWVDDAGEVGAARRRKRFTRQLGNWSFTLYLTKTQADALETFYDTTLDAGVSEFNWTHPFTAVTHEVRFSGRPRIKHLFNSRYSADVTFDEI